MAISKIQVGQVWKKFGSDESFLVTRLYTVENSPAGQGLPGFSMANDSNSFQ
jgi:hypothetical protein